MILSKRGRTFHVGEVQLFVMIENMMVFFLTSSGRSQKGTPVEMLNSLGRIYPE